VRLAMLHHQLWKSLIPLMSLLHHHRRLLAVVVASLSQAQVFHPRKPHLLPWPRKAPPRG